MRAGFLESENERLTEENEELQAENAKLRKIIEEMGHWNVFIMDLNFHSYTL